MGTAHQNHSQVGGQCPPCELAAGLLLLLAFAIFRMPPWLPLFAVESNGVDPSWQMLLNEAASNDWVFGRDLFFTYGPFGFIHARMYHPETWGILTAAWIGVSVIMADLVWRVTGHGRSSSVGRVLFGGAILEFMSRDAMAVCFGLHALVFLEAAGFARKNAETQRADSMVGTLYVYRQAIPILLLAALPWAKFSYFVTAAFLGCVLLAAGVFQRRFPWRAALLFAACPLAWFMSGATLAECGEFISTGLQLAGGYSAAMGLGPASTSGLIVVVTSACVVLLLPIWFSSRIQDHDWRMRMLTMLFLHGLLFIVWKSCFVRYHAERIPVFLGTVLPLLAYGIFCLRAGEGANLPVGRFSGFLHSVNRRLVMPGTFAVLFVMMLAGTAERVRPLSPGETITHATRPLRDQILAVVETIEEPTWRQNTHNAQLEEIRRANPIPDIDGTVDVFPGKLAVAFAHGLKLQPRPVLQGYAAFTPRLIDRDAQHFRGQNAPDHVLMSMGEIDGRLPTMEDSRAWFELLSRYDLTDSSCELLKLSRRHHPALVLSQEPASSTTVKFGEQVNLPHGLAGPVWCRIQIESSLAGRAASILYRLPELRLRLHCDRGTDREFRLLPGSIRSGFLISPVVETREDLIRLWQWRDGLDAENTSSEGRVVSIACWAANQSVGDMSFATDVTVEFIDCIKRVDSMSESARPTDVATRERSSF